MDKKNYLKEIKTAIFAAALTVAFGVYAEEQPAEGTKAEPENEVAVDSANDIATLQANLQQLQKDTSEVSDAAQKRRVLVTEENAEAKKLVSEIEALSKAIAAKNADLEKILNDDKEFSELDARYKELKKKTFEAFVTLRKAEMAQKSENQ